LSQLSRARILARLAALALCVLPAAGALCPLPAQSGALVVFGYGGRHTPLVDLSTAGDDFTAAFSYGGGLALQLSQRSAIRASVTRFRTRYRGTAATPADSSATRYAIAADLQIGWPTTSALVPYVFVGGGGIITDLDDPALPKATDAMGRFGVGMNRVSGLGAWFLEFAGILYKYDGLGFDRFQFDVEGRLGFAVAIGW
jgi:hypothetical protein